MKTECPPMKTLLAGLGILGITVGSLGCSDGTTTGSGGAPGTGGTGAGATGGTPSTGGKATTGGSSGAGGSSGTTGGSSGTGGTVSGAGGTGTGGASGTGGGSSGTGGGSGSGSGGAGAGGAGSGGASAGMSGSGVGGAGRGGGGRGGAATGGGAGSSGTSGTGGAFSGTCNASKATGANASGTGPHDVVIETNSENGIKCGTIYRPADLGEEKYPIFVWGEGGCSQNGSSNQAAMAEIASWGYFVVADGTPGGNNACAGSQDGKQLLDYLTWSIAENDKPCSAYYQSIETTKIAADGFSCGGLMSENASSDPRFTAIGITSSGLMGASASIWGAIHTPFKIMNGGSSDVAYENGLRDYDGISALGIPILYFSKTSAGHGGDLGNGRGDFNLVNLAWLNWQLKGDEGATGKGYLYGSTCKICTDSGWDYKSANIE